MSIQVKKLHAALKHGAYSATAVLPGEDLAAFKELHKKVIAELAPVGPLEDDIVATITRLLWRKQNLATFRVAELALEYEAAIRKEKLPTPLEFPEFGVLPGRGEAALQATEDQARKELGDRYALVEIGATATVDRLLQELMVEERLDAMIDKRIKRLLHLRGLKCLSTARSSPPLQQTAATARIPSPWEQVEQAISPSV
jgi:hypothetical protein